MKNKGRSRVETIVKSLCLQRRESSTVSEVRVGSCWQNIDVTSSKLSRLDANYVQK